MALSILRLVLLASSVVALNFDWERTQLKESETTNYTAIRFGREAGFPPSPRKACKTIPGDKEWPSDAEWEKFNNALGGALLKPKPLASVCYAGENYDQRRCQQLRSGWTNMNIHANDPISIMSQWATGHSCVATTQSNATGSTCTQGGYPAYVVNATTARHIQMAINFARNNNIRLVIKNSGHDPNGKSIGAYSLSVWVHNLRAMQYFPDYESPTNDYRGRAVAYSAGTKSVDAQVLMSQNNFTMMTAGGATVGIAGGYLQGGGHSTYTSSWGLVADNVLSLTAVTADGRLIEANENENEDLYWAFRGGGGGTYGVLTSVVVKAFPETPVTAASITITTVPPRTGADNTTLSIPTFWEGVKAYLAFCKDIADAGGLGYNFIKNTPYPGNSSQSGFTFQTSITAPNKTNEQFRAWIAPFYNRLAAHNISVPRPRLKRSLPHQLPNPILDPEHPYLTKRALNDSVGNALIASRFFQRPNFATEARLSEMTSALRVFVEEGGYTFHGINHAPSFKVSGYPDNSVNPAHRNTLMHAEGYEPNAWFDSMSPVLTYEEQRTRHDRLQFYMQKWRDVTPGSGSYINEGDAQEPDFKAAFFGRNYERLLEIKREWDPEGVFWAIGAVGHDEWEIRKDGKAMKGLVTQDGQLCRKGR